MALPRAYFGMQCFWGESAFAKIDGVVNTRVGYAGGTSLNPTYRAIGDHTELVFDDRKVSYEDLLHFFFSHHDPTVHHKAQYRSLVLYTDDGQKEKAEEILEKVTKSKPNTETKVQKLEVFYQAEDYHQKYWLRSQHRLHSQLGLTDQQLVESELATKVNAFLAGYDDFTVLHSLAKQYNLSSDLTTSIEAIAKAGGDPRACH